MDIKKIEKASKYIAEVKELDAKITALEKAGNSVNEGASDLKVSLSFNSLKTPKKEDILDWDGSLKTSDRPKMGFSFDGSGFLGAMVNYMKTPEPSNLISESVDQEHFFLFLNYMLKVYADRRAFMLKKINEILS